MSKKKEIQPESENNIGKIEETYITDEIQTSYIDYAMSVIISRALPDARDGLKPVQRRILFAMWQTGLRSTSRFKKSANVVGEVMGKYHPHGDSSIYEAMVRMAQDFSYRLPLINGQGNFGSVDGDPPAAMRYTEAKMSLAAETLMQDIDKETVNFYPNYDETQKEPRVVPAGLPNLLLNGSVGIAVGMATNIPPHNLGELIDGIVHLIDNPKSTVRDLMKHVKGPDFPTGGIMYNQKDIEDIYTTGKGSVVVRGRAEIIEAKGDKYTIIITELPYQVNKAHLLQKIADLVKDKKIEGIKDLRDESDRDGMRVVIELKKDAYSAKILNQLYKLTQLQETFHANMIALVDGGIQPRVLTLHTALEEFVNHRQEIVKRRAEYELKKAKDRVHILEGLKVALNNIDAVIKLIKASKDKEAARVGLMKKFKLTEIQATAILEMRLQQLANLERQKILDELKELKKLIKELESLLASKKKVLTVIKNELLGHKAKLANERRTEVIKHAVGSFSQEDLIPNEPTIVTVTADGYIKRLSPDVFKTQGRGGKGVSGLATRENDGVEHFVSTNTHADLLFFTSRGRVFVLKGYEVPQGSRTSKGQAVVNFLQLDPQENISAVLPAEDMQKFKSLVMVTSNGFVKKVAVEDFKNVRRSGLIAIKLKPNDELKWVKASKGKDEIVIVTKMAQAIRFKETGVRAMGRAASGVRAIKLKKGDSVLAMDIVYNDKIKEDPQLFVLSELGFGKRTMINQYKVQGRGGSGIKTATISNKNGSLVSSHLIYKNDLAKDIIIISSKGQVIRLPIKSISSLGRATQGVRLMRFKEASDKVASAVAVEAVAKTEKSN